MVSRRRLPGWRRLDVNSSPTERVSNAMHGADELCLLRAITDRPPYFAHQDIEVPLHDEGVGPDSRVQVRLLHDVWSALNQRTQQVERFRGKVYFRSSAKKLPRV